MSARFLRKLKQRALCFEKDKQKNNKTALPVYNQREIGLGSGKEV